MGKILLFYHYITIDDPNALATWQRELCEKLDLHGRIIIAHEGINGTVGGSSESADAYIQAMQVNPLFRDVDFKESDGEKHDFPRLRVVVKEEIVHLGLDPTVLQAKDGGTHLSPEETHTLLQNKPDDLVVLDARNSYESAIGTFEGAIKPEINNFREFPDYVDEHLDDFKDKKVFMFCTGGIRCERASAYLKSKGINEVYQLSGGIHRYAEQYPNGFFRGKNYVFDRRVAIKINDDILSTCSVCAASCDTYINCSNASCNEHFICCERCRERLGNCCSQTCAHLLETGQVKPRPRQHEACFE